MKQATKKTLGVVALGTAVAAAGAGVASAAGPNETLGSVGNTASNAVESISAADLPGELAETLDSTGKSLNGAKDTAKDKTSLAGGETASAPGGGMLGGLPLNGLPLGG